MTIVVERAIGLGVLEVIAVAARSPPRMRSPPSRFVADTWAPSPGRPYTRPRSRSPPLYRRRSRSPPPYNRAVGVVSYTKTYASRKFSPRRDVRARSPVSSSRRPRSPFREDRARDSTWSHNTSTSRQPGDSSGRDYGYYRANRRPPSAGRHTRPGSPPRNGLSFDDDQCPAPRARSPFTNGRRDTTADRYHGQRRRSQSSNGTFAKRPSAPGSMSNSRRSSPFDDRNNSIRSNRSRSPHTSYTPGRRRSRERETSTSRDHHASAAKSTIETPEARLKSPGSERMITETSSFSTNAETPQTSEQLGRTTLTRTSYPSNAPSQPRAFSNNRNRKSPSPPGPPHGPKTLPSHPRSSNISLLSAPTRPRGSSNFKDSGWAGPSMRRGPAPSGPHGMPIVARNNHLSASGTELQRSRSCRPNSVPGTSPNTPRHAKYLVGLNTIVPGGKLAPTELDSITEKRLSQLDADKDRLFNQIAESQKLKRAGLRDWDKLDRESSICALKSELAEGHLQCITDAEGIFGRALF
ncbi:uncharacterized protein ANIA_11225 [Aspergillus nidulans FGSC A4]|uniref:Uncharacterized protein n=1 Tax=Emericella nidulans (strain FGSC A4 / ATCC 38163 / CBS 112.46 / NRRL 194 / M139) TaxID=227321 RepID=C8V3S3_EMENI|nr:hypothetical protein [Aspergillus nidulans FGSC A4]CBF74308.1 TPA: conserved hypothetical protein [Aspergillus nidulans FGSC A4]